MKMNSFSKSFIFLIVAGGAYLTACQKQSNSSGSTPANDSTAANLSASSIASDNAYNDVLTIALQAGSDNNIDRVIAKMISGGVQANSTRGVHIDGDSSGSCAAYTVSPADNSTFPKTITVDFGTGCVSLDGITRSGKITFLFSGRLLTPGTTVSASFANYVVNGFGLQGTYSLTNNSSVNGIAYSTQVTNGQINFPDASWFTFSGHRSVVQIAGQSTPLDFSDDVYSITGSHTCASSNNKTLHDSVTTALVKANSCSWISSGILSFTYYGISGTVDFGNGTCDNQATIKVGIIQEPITLH
jgi:hypothetical protein